MQRRQEINKSIQIIAGRLVRKPGRKPALVRIAAYLATLKFYQEVFLQKRGDSDKTYSLHEPDVKYNSKGKEYKDLSWPVNFLSLSAKAPVSL